MKGDRFVEVGFGAAWRVPDRVWRGPWRESAACSSLALTTRGHSLLFLRPVKPHIYKRPSSLAVLSVPPPSHLDNSFATPCEASWFSICRRLSGMATSFRKWLRPPPNLMQVDAGLCRALLVLFPQNSFPPLVLCFGSRRRTLHQL